MANLISIYNDDAITEEFRKRIPRPSRLTAAPITLLRAGYYAIRHIYNVDIPPASAEIGRLAKDARIAAIAWQWINPDLPYDTSELLRDYDRHGVRRHHTLDGFFSAIDERLSRSAHRAPALDRYIARRRADLEYAHLCTKQSDLSLDPDPHIREHLLQCLAASSRALQDDPGAAAALAKDGYTSALTAIAELVRRTLSPSGADTSAPFSANLMVPLIGESRSFESALGDLAGTPACERATAIWGSRLRASTDQLLTVIVEVPERQHLGFWVPDWRGDRDQPLPGAPWALFHGHTSALYKDDLPFLRGFDREVEWNWHHYMKEILKDSLIVSIPVWMRPLHTQPVAIVNVNLRINGFWPRALSSRWRAHVTHLASPLTALTFNIFYIWMLACAGRSSTDRMGWSDLSIAYLPDRASPRLVLPETAHDPTQEQPAPHPPARLAPGSAPHVQRNSTPSGSRRPHRSRKAKKRRR